MDRHLIKSWFFASSTHYFNGCQMFLSFCLHTSEVELRNWPLNPFNLTPSSSSVVHDQHCSHLQSLEKQWDQMLREWTARVLWWHGVARQHERREPLPAYFISLLSSFVLLLYAFFWHDTHQACQAVSVVAYKNIGEKNTVRNIFVTLPWSPHLRHRAAVHEGAG